jgi:hypothetical protein
MTNDGIVEDDWCLGIPGRIGDGCWHWIKAVRGAKFTPTRELEPLAGDSSKEDFWKICLVRVPILCPAPTFQAVLSTVTPMPATPLALAYGTANWRLLGQCVPTQVIGRSRWTSIHVQLETGSEGVKIDVDNPCSRS